MTNTKADALLNPSKNKHEAINFPNIQPADFLPALSTAIELAKKSLNACKEGPASFESTILAIETCGEQVDHISKIYFNLLSAHSNKELQELAEKIGPKLSEFSSDILLDQQLFEQVKKVYEQKATLKLNGEQTQLLENTYQDFVRNGSLLNEEQKKQLRAIDKELSQLGPKFSDNVLKATNNYELVVTKKEDLEGLPESSVDAAAALAKKKGKTGWIFNLQGPSYVPFLTYAKNRELRERLWKSFNSKAFNDEFDNQQLILKIVTLRHQRAELLGFKNHADFVLRRRMAETPQKVMEFIDNLVLYSAPVAKKEFEAVSNFAKAKDGVERLMPWDWAYYSERLKEKTFKFSEEELRPYFKLENVINGVFEHATRLFGLNFKESKDYPTYHPEVQVFEVYEESKEFVGLLYVDLFPRETKKPGAWMTNYKDQGMLGGKVVRPHISIVCNFTPSIDGKPSLLSLTEVETLFHEFGHALHGLLSKCHYRSLSGTNVFWDFVELPSQIFENWTHEKEGLSLFAKHYQTGAPMPDELIEKIQQSSKFLAGSFSLRQLTFASLDMAWHSTKPKDIHRIDDFEDKASVKLRFLPKIEGTNVSCSFAHIFDGGYSAGYYSYKWAEVLDADAFALFQEKGIFDKSTATAFKKHILERGGSEHPMELYKRFRGREPDTKALLKRQGLLATGNEVGTLG
jgi:peptidyl-dipeptidase Dcp